MKSAKSLRRALGIAWIPAAGVALAVFFAIRFSAFLLFVYWSGRGLLPEDTVVYFEDTSFLAANALYVALLYFAAGFSLSYLMDERVYRTAAAMGIIATTLGIAWLEFLELGYGPSPEVQPWWYIAAPAYNIPLAVFGSWLWTRAHRKRVT